MSRDRREASREGGVESGDTVTMSQALGREIRSGDAVALGVATDEAIVAAVAQGDAEGAARMLSYARDEKLRMVHVFSRWLETLLSIAQDRVPGIDAELARLTQLIGAPQPLDVDRAAASEFADLERAVSGGSSAEVCRLVQAWSDAIRKLHDCQADWCWALLSALYHAVGELEMEGIFRESLGGWFTERYAALAKMTPREWFEITAEAMRGHFSGSDRRGSIEIVEEKDRWVLRFDPCGTGGRMMRGDPAAGQVSRIGPPFDFVMLKTDHAWTWGERGICLYCAHCSFVNEILPIERFDTPLRVTRAPRHPDEKCEWIVYKSPELVPDEAFERVGKAREFFAEGTP